jgi:hypothetical protein
MALVLYLIIRKDDLAQCTRQLAVPRRYVTAKWNYIGLRESVAEAVERRRKTWGESEVTDDTHIVLKVIVTHIGVSVLTRLTSAPEDFFASTLYKKPTNGVTLVDWKVWHFVGDLPLEGHTGYNEEVYTVQWMSLTEAESVSEPECATRLTLCEDDASRSS